MGDLHWNQQAACNGGTQPAQPNQITQPRINRQQQDGHIEGKPQYDNRVRHNKPTSTWMDDVDADALTQEAWSKGALQDGNPNVRLYDFRTPIGEGNWGQTQTQAHVTRNARGRSTALRGNR